MPLIECWYLFLCISLAELLRPRGKNVKLPHVALEIMEIVAQTQQERSLVQFYLPGPRRDVVRDAYCASQMAR